MLYSMPQAAADSWLGGVGRRLEKALDPEFDGLSTIICAIIYALCALIFLWPGTFYVGLMLNDAFIYAEAGYRLASGQVPGRDATNALGVFAYLPHALAFRLTHDVVRAIPLSFAIFGAIVLAFGCVLAVTRLSAVIGVAVVLTCCLVMLAPFVIGFPMPPNEVMTTGAMSYNRFGFILVLFATLLVIDHDSAHPAKGRVIDVVWAVAATMLAYYAKMPFGLAVAGLVGFWLVAFRRDWLGLIFFLAGCALVASIFEAIWPGLNAAYVREMIFAFHASGGTKPVTLVSLMIRTAPEVLVVAIVPLIALYSCNCADWRDGVFAALLVFGSLLLLSQGAQGPVLVTPVAIAVIAVTRLHRAPPTPAHQAALWVSMLGVVIGLSGLAVPAAVTLARHTVAAQSAAPVPGMPFNYRSLRVGVDADTAGLDAAFAGRFDGAQAYSAARQGSPRDNKNALYENEYAHTVAALEEARDLCGTQRDRTAVLDFANVSSSLFGHQPAGAWAYLHWGRSFGPNAFVPAPRMFSGVGCLFDPKLPQNPTAHGGIWTVYGDYLRAAYRVAGETPFWRVLVISPEPK
jgi:hypothetical protein